MDLPTSPVKHTHTSLKSNTCQPVEIQIKSQYITMEMVNAALYSESILAWHLSAADLVKTKSEERGGTMFLFSE